MMRWLLLVVLAAGAPLAAQQVLCSYSLSQTAILLPGTSTSGTVQVAVTAAAGQTCTWTFSTTASWIHIQPITGTGSGPIPYSVEANNSNVLRQDVITFTAPGLKSDIPITLYQQAGICT